MKMEKAMFGLMMVFAAMLLIGFFGVVAVVAYGASTVVGAVAVATFIIGAVGVVAVGHA
jgi:hypothetical protein